MFVPVPYMNSQSREPKALVPQVAGHREPGPLAAINLEGFWEALGCSRPGKR